MIELKNVSKSYALDNETFLALSDINLNIRQGEQIAITGPSGCGKSTLMHIIGLLDEPTSGQVIIKGKNISNLSDNELSQLRNEFAGFIFQQFNLINKLTVLENILLPTHYYRKKLKYNPQTHALELMSRFGIYEKAKSYPNKLSGGQQQRVAIARALINQPKIILADEPTGNLDSKTGSMILHLLKKLNKNDKLTLIIVTHDREIASYFDRNIRMFDGKIQKNIK